MMALSLSAFNFLLVDWTMLPGPGSISISVPLKFSHRPPEAASCLVTINLAPAVPRKVIVSVEISLLLMPGITISIIEDRAPFYNCFIRAVLCFDNIHFL